MKETALKILVGIVSILFIAFIVTAVIKESKEPNPGDSGKGVFPVSKEMNFQELEVIGKYDTRFGNLYVYKLGGDTVYVAEGQSQNAPISINVK